MRYNPKVQFWSGPLQGAGEVRFETELTVTFGEFLQAIFTELGFHGSPADRDAALEDLHARGEAIDRLREDDND